jgi:hypothetical protein
MNDRRILGEIKVSHERSGGSYGVRRIWPDVVESAYQVGRERVARIMRAAGISVRIPVKMNTRSGSK